MVQSGDKVLEEEVIKINCLLKVLVQAKKKTQKPSNEIIRVILTNLGTGESFLSGRDAKKIIMDEIERLRAELNQTAITKGINSKEVMEISRKFDSMNVRFLKDDF